MNSKNAPIVLHYALGWNNTLLGTGSANTQHEVALNSERFAVACEPLDRAEIRAEYLDGNWVVSRHGAAPSQVAAGQSLRVDCGEFVLHLQAAEAELLPRAVTRMDRTLAGSLLGTGAIAASLLGAMMMIPSSAWAISNSMEDSSSRLLQYMTAASEIPPPPEPVPTPGPEGASGQRAEGESGTSGAADEKRNTGGQIRRRGRDEATEMAVTAANVRTQGVLNVLDSLRNFASVASPYGIENARAADLEDAYGDFMAANAGWSPGSGGIGPIGSGRGGGCPAGSTTCGDGTIGVGDLNGIGGRGTCGAERFHQLEASIGHAAAVVQCSGDRVGGGINTGMHRTAKVPPRIQPGVADVSAGGLSKEDIRRVIQRRLPEIRSCYEQSLSARPDLNGRITVGFLIQPSGGVQGARIIGDELRDGRTATCITQALSRWAFPQSISPTLVREYPFRFQSAQ